MTTNNRGYSTVFLAAVNSADPELPAVQLAKLCMEHGIPMAFMADKLKVSRATMYNWAVGKSTPKEKNLSSILKWVARLRGQA